MLQPALDYRRDSPKIHIPRSQDTTVIQMPQLHKTEYSYRILSRLNSYTLPAFYRKIIDQVVIIVAKHSKTAYKIISEHLHCTVCHQIPLLGFRSLPDPPLGEFNITVSQKLVLILFAQCFNKSYTLPTVQTSINIYILFQRQPTVTIIYSFIIIDTNILVHSMSQLGCIQM